MYTDTTAAHKIFSLTKRIRAVCGGTSASKTISIMIWLIDYCQSLDKEGKPVNANKLCSVVSESYPHLEKGAMLDFQTIMKSRGYWNDNNWNATKHTYTFETGAKLEFFSPDTYGKAHGPRRDVLFVNEANNIEYSIFDQLRVRTRETIWLDWNPTSEFWFYTELQPNYSQGIDFITLTYKDNEGLDQQTVEDIESHKHNENWWKVYGLGQLGEIETRIYKGWRIIDNVPYEARLERRGLDFGYSNDPACIVDIYYYNGGYIFSEQLYQKGMSNKRLADVLLNLPHAECLVIADSAEPKSIDEIREYGVNIVGANKGKGSVNQGISLIQDQQVSITSKSLNMLKEYRQYLWQTDKYDNILPIPEDKDNHAMDAVRYGMESLRPGRTEAGAVSSPLNQQRDQIIIGGKNMSPSLEAILNRGDIGRDMSWML